MTNNLNRRILGVLLEEGSATAYRVRKIVGWPSESVVKRHLEGLVRVGLVEKSGARTRSDPDLYRPSGFFSAFGELALGGVDLEEGCP